MTGSLRGRKTLTLLTLRQRVAPCPPPCGVRGQMRGNGRGNPFEGRWRRYALQEGRIEKERLSEKENKEMRNGFCKPHFPSFCPALLYCRLKRGIKPAARFPQIPAVRGFSRDSKLASKMKGWRQTGCWLVGYQKNNREN